MTKAAIYLRSSVKQHNLASQRAECLAYAEQNGYTIAGEYVDAGEPAGGGHQDVLKILSYDAAEGEFEVVVVPSVDRLARQPGVLHSLDRSGVRIETVC